MLKYAKASHPLYYYHNLQISKKSFNKNSKLKKFFRIAGISYNSSSIKDHTKSFYISAFEAYDYPIYGIQFHPEIN